MTFNPTYDFSQLSESDVREEIIRPFLNKLGYRSGTENNIRTEITLRYSRIYLGRKNPEKDPELVGRADYICDVTGFGRWIVEAKSPRHPITQEDANQAHSYAAHPEVGAIFYLVTNGKDWMLYRTSAPGTALLTWKYEDLDEKDTILHNILAPTAIKKLHEVNIDVGKPLAVAQKSSLQIAGGFVEYGDLQAAGENVESNLGGLRNAVPEGYIKRTDNDQIEFAVKLLSANSGGDPFSQLIGLDWVHFATAQEYLSIDKTAPTIATFSHTVTVKAGTKVGGYTAGPPLTVLPFDLTVNAFAEAVAFLEGDKLMGTFNLEMNMSSDSPLFRMAPANIRRMETVGQFTLTVK